MDSSSRIWIILLKWLEKFSTFNFKTIKYNIMNRITKNEDFWPSRSYEGNKAALYGTHIESHIYAYWQGYEYEYIFKLVCGI